MAASPPLPARDVDEQAALKSIVEGTATETGERFFSAMVENLAAALGTHGAWVTRYEAETQQLHTLAFWLGGDFIPDYVFDLPGTPCEEVIKGARLVHIPDNILDVYPGDAQLREAGMVSYLGAPLMGGDDRILGHMGVIDTQPLPAERQVMDLFRIFSARAGAELRRLRAETEAREREEKLSRLVDSAMDAIVELDSELRVTRLNPAAEKIFGTAGSRLLGRPFTRHLSQASGAKLKELISQLDSRPSGQRFMWIPGGLEARGAAGRSFQTEATLSRYELRHQRYHTLILRDMDERLETDRKLRSLTVETEYLREELKALSGFEDIIGKSEAIQRVLLEVEQVAAADTTVLILGETGTGKELVAKAIHCRSRRRDRPLIKVNCAAIPEKLVESELFGHERGAFTGATQRREGRFALADGGTVFLDEVGELPLEMQSKLLRVLQEGEFEPVGSSRTRRVDVRVLAATNRDLEQAVGVGEFREDLFYRLNVFPLPVPPLRARSEDVGLLACAFVRMFAQRMGRNFEPPSEDCLYRLRSYAWPGNVRELQNVIERAMVTSRDGRLNLDRALPENDKTCRSSPAATDPLSADNRIRTVTELQDLERSNLLLALQSAGWRVSGNNGAAELLGMKPSTLTSRMKALGIKRP